MNAFLKITTVASLSVIGATSATANIVSDRFSAVATAEQAFRQQPDNAEIQFKLGRAYLMAGRYLSAWQCLNKLVLRDPYNEKARLYMGLAAIGNNNKTAAQSILLPITRVSPVDLGLALTLAGQPAEAIKRMEPLLSTPSNSVRLRQNLAFAYATADRWNDAAKMAGQDLSADQASARLGQWNRVVHERNGALQLQAFIGVPPAKDSGFLSSTPAPLSTPQTVSTASPMVAPTATVSRPAATPPTVTSTSVPPASSTPPSSKPATTINSYQTKSSDSVAQPVAPAATNPTTIQPASPVASTSTAAASSITEIDLPSANSASTPSEKMTTAPSVSPNKEAIGTANQPQSPITPLKDKPSLPQAAAQPALPPKKSLNLPIKEIVAENSKKPDSAKATVTSSLNKPEKKEVSPKTPPISKDKIPSTEEQNCPAATCHMVTYPAIQLATHKLPVSSAATEQSHKILQGIQAKWPAAAKYKIMTYSEAGSPVYRLLLTGFASAKEAQESCSSLMKKDISCMPSSYKEAVHSTKKAKKTK